MNWHGWPMMGPMELHLRLYFTRNPCHSDHRSLVHISSMSSSCHELHVFILNKSLRWYYRSLWWVIISERKWWVIGGTNWPIKIRMKHKLFSTHVLSINYFQYDYLPDSYLISSWVQLCSIIYALLDAPDHYHATIYFYEVS